MTEATRTAVPVPSASVHPPQTNVVYSDDDRPPAELPLDSAGAAFRHSCWRHDRSRVYAALRSVALSPMRVARFESCGSGARVYRSKIDPDRVVVAPCRCSDRFCVPCSRDRGRIFAQNVLKQVADDQYRFLTLTLKHRDEALSSTVDRIYRSFRALRASKSWKRHVDGGCAFLETTYNRDFSQWHVHLHCLVSGSFYPKRSIETDWLRITGDSFIVDIRLIRGPKQVIHYTTKYASKPTTTTVLRDSPRLKEAIEAFTGRRLCLTYGQWRGVRLAVKTDTEAWIDCGPLRTVIEAYTRGEPEALSLIAGLPELNVSATIAWLHVQAPPRPESYWREPDPTPVGLFELSAPWRRGLPAND